MLMCFQYICCKHMGVTNRDKNIKTIYMDYVILCYQVQSRLYMRAACSIISGVRERW